MTSAIAANFPAFSRVGNVVCRDMSKGIRNPKRTTGYVLGRQNFAKISAVESIRLSRDQNGDFGDFDRKALPSKARRAILAAKYGARSASR